MHELVICTRLAGERRIMKLSYIHILAKLCIDLQPLKLHMWVERLPDPVQFITLTDEQRKYRGAAPSISHNYDLKDALWLIVSKVQAFDCLANNLGRVN